jgi:hypothetical protein
LTNWYKQTMLPKFIKTKELSKCNTTVSLHTFIALRFAVYFGHKNLRMLEHNKMYFRSLKCSVNNTTPLTVGTVYVIRRVLTHTPASFKIFKIRPTRTVKSLAHLQRTHYFSTQICPMYCLMYFYHVVMYSYVQLCTVLDMRTCSH